MRAGEGLKKEARDDYPGLSDASLLCWVLADGHPSAHAFALPTVQA